MTDTPNATGLADERRVGLDGIDLVWLADQLQHWPTRIHPERTCNIGWLHETGATAIRLLSATLPISQGSTASGEGEVERVARQWFEGLSADHFGQDIGSRSVVTLTSDEVTALCKTLASLPTRTPDGDLLGAAWAEAIKRYPDALPGLVWFTSATGLRAGKVEQKHIDWADAAISKAHGHHVGEGA